MRVDLGNKLLKFKLIIYNEKHSIIVALVS